MYNKSNFGSPKWCYHCDH